MSHNLKETASTVLQWLLIKKPGNSHPTQSNPIHKVSRKSWLNPIHGCMDESVDGSNPRPLSNSELYQLKAWVDAYACVQWTVFVQFLLVHQPQCVSVPQRWLTDPYGSGASRPVQSCSFRRSTAVVEHRSQFVFVTVACFSAEPTNSRCTSLSHCCPGDLMSW